MKSLKLYFLVLIFLYVTLPCRASNYDTKVGVSVEFPDGFETIDSEESKVVYFLNDEFSISITHVIGHGTIEEAGKENSYEHFIDGVEKNYPGAQLLSTKINNTNQVFYADLEFSLPKDVHDFKNLYFRIIPLKKSIVSICGMCNSDCSSIQDFFDSVKLDESASNFTKADKREGLADKIVLLVSVIAAIGVVVTNYRKKKRAEKDSF